MICTLADEMNLFVRTASKYDDCQLMHVPNVVLLIKLDWLCLGNPNDHHSIMPCAREKLPEYSHNVEHDSYRAFRLWQYRLWSFRGRDTKL